MIYDENNNGPFAIGNDVMAEWAINKIKDAQEEHDRLIALVEAQEQALEEKRAEIDKSLETATGYLKSMLYDYLKMVKTKKTATQETYKLLSGKLVHKYPAKKIVKDDGALLAWTKENRPEYIKTKEDVDWATMKKELIVTEDGSIVDGTGCIVEGLTTEETAGSFDIKF